MIDDIIVFWIKIITIIATIVVTTYLITKGNLEDDVVASAALKAYKEGISGMKFHNKFDFTGLKATQYQKDAVNSYADPYKYAKQISNILGISEPAVKRRIINTKESK